MKLHFLASICSLLVSASLPISAKTPVQERRISSPLPKISSTIPGRGGQLLVETATAFLESLRKSLPMPNAVQFIPEDQNGAHYADGYVYAAMPMVKEVKEADGQIRKFEKSLEQSLPINLHEIGHQLVEAYINKNFKDKPQVKWLFEYVHFAPYDEFLADTLAILFLKDPKAIANNLDFSNEDDTYHKNDWWGDWARLSVFSRDFSARVTEKDFNDLMNSQYGFTLPTKIFVWSAIYPRMIAPNSTLSHSETSLRIFEAVFESFQSLSKNYTAVPELNIKEINSSLIVHMCRKFSISPCIDPTFGEHR